MTNWTREQEAAARARCDAATKGPWHWQDFGDGLCLVASYGPRPVVLIALDGGLGNRDVKMGYLIPLNPEHPDSAFLKHARTDLPDALDEIERLRQELIERGRGACRSLGL